MYFLILHSIAEDISY